MVATAVDLTRRGGDADDTGTSDAADADGAADGAPATDRTLATLDLTMRDEKIVLPLAPALGLYLDRPYFEPYNNQLKDQPKVAIPFCYVLFGFNACTLSIVSTLLFCL